MKFIVVALFAIVAVASALPAGPVDHTVDTTKGSKDDLKASEAVYVASPYAASPYVASYPAVTAYSAAVPAVSAYSAYSAYPAAVPAVSAYSYGYAPSAYAYYYR